MKLQEFILFAKANPLCYLATCDGNQPHVRGMMLFFADESGFYFGTLSAKDMTKQLHKNPKVEICFCNNPDNPSLAKQMRLTGEIEFVSDPVLIHRMHEERKFLDDIVGENLEPYTQIFKVTTGDLHFWTMPEQLTKKQIEHFSVS
jgi:pyridoxamine 5'-phosphate oxidase